MLYDGELNDHAKYFSVVTMVTFGYFISYFQNNIKLNVSFLASSFRITSSISPGFQKKMHCCDETLAN